MPPLARQLRERDSAALTSDPTTLLMMLTPMGLSASEIIIIVKTSHHSMLTLNVDVNANTCSQWCLQDEGVQSSSACQSSTMRASEDGKHQWQ